MAERARRDVSRVKGLGLADVVRIAQDNTLQSLSVPYLSQCAGLVKESFVFAILTVNEKTDRAENAMIAWRAAGEPADAPTIRKVCGPHSPLAGTENGTWNKARCIEEFLTRYSVNPEEFTKGPGESASEYRDRIYKLGVKGLALTKTTWACQLASGGGSIACMDRHMMRLMLGRMVTNDELNTRKPKTEKLYRRLERVLVHLSDRYGWHSASALQWSVWSSALKEVVTHDVVWAPLSTVSYRRVG